MSDMLLKHRVIDMNNVGRFVVAVALLGIWTSTWADRSVFLEATFETGQVQRANSAIDGIYIQTLPDPQLNGEGISSGSGGFGPDTNWDTKVVGSEIVGNRKVVPRDGNYFLRSAIYRNKDYLVLNSNKSNKPRAGINLAGTNAGQAFEHDEEAWIGFSIFLPTNWEHELGVTDERGSAQILSISDITRTASVAVLTIWTPKGAKEAHWHVRFQVDDSSVSSGSTTRREVIDLGPVTPDLGKWTDFVFRVRSNPFEVATNPAKAGIPNAKDQLYQGKRGIFQVWKSEEADRSMSLKIDKVNTPIGHVPHAVRPIEVSFRLYKYGWHNNPTTVNGPVWVGYDEMRYGTTDRHGTRFLDVVPSGQSQIAAAPLPPTIAVE